jgi:hypothetical protein
MPHFVIASDLSADQTQINFQTDDNHFYTLDLTTKKMDNISDPKIIQKLIEKTKKIVEEMSPCSQSRSISRRRP